MRALWLAALLAAAVAGCGGEERAPQPLARIARACAHDSELSCPRPIFTVRDLAASTRYYRDKLGFKLDWEHGDPPDFASVTRGDGTLFMCENCQGHPGAWAMLFARDVDKLHDEFRRKGAEIRMPPTNKPWGLREMHVADPDGNVLRFGSGIDDD